MTLLATPTTIIPGIGKTSGTVILGEIGEIIKFASSKKLVAFTGLDATSGCPVSLKVQKTT